MFSVYAGYDDKENIIYIGTTIQKPSDRFRWHRNNGKNFNFKVLKECKTEKEMLDLEFELIKKHDPIHNKIKHRKQNFNKKLIFKEIEKRKGDVQWCQSCLKRRVSKGYKKCFWCS